jgi:hypothetical protein
MEIVYLKSQGILLSCASATDGGRSPSRH